MDKKELAELKKLPFEKALEELEKTVARMEGGEMALDNLMQDYEKGQALAAICSEKLKSIEKKVEILRKKATGDEWEEFDADAEQTSSAPVPEKNESAVNNNTSEETDIELPF